MSEPHVSHWGIVPVVCNDVNWIFNYSNCLFNTVLLDDNVDTVCRSSSIVVVVVLSVAIVSSVIILAS